MLVEVLEGKEEVLVAVLDAGAEVWTAVLDAEAGASLESPEWRSVFSPWFGTLEGAGGVEGEMENWEGLPVRSTEPTSARPSPDDNCDNIG